MKRVKLQPAFVLHTRPFRDSSLLVDLLTMNHGRIHAIARSARGMKSRYRGILRPFVSLLISWSGNHELVTLGNVELTGASYDLMGKVLLSGFYLNELLVRLLHFNDAHPHIYDAYQDALIRLSKENDSEIALRIFEKSLLFALGYGLQLQYDAITGKPIDYNAYYEFNAESGFIRKTYNNLTHSPATFSGKDLLAIYGEQFNNTETLKAAKRLMRLALAPLLGEKPIKSRELFNNINEMK